MAIFRSLKTLLRNPFMSGRQHSFLIFFPFATPHPLFPPAIRSRLLLFTISQWAVPIRGPLFLSSPPWKLLQSATPFYLQCDSFFRRDSDFLVSTHSVTGIVAMRERVRRCSGSEFINLPNLISFSRLISGPLIAWVITKEWYLSAFVGLAVSGATDWLDGFVARKMNINSVVGSYLDPLADKVLIGSVAMAMVHNDLLHPGLVGLIVFRDVALVSAAFYERANNLGWMWRSWSDYFNIDQTSRKKMEPLLISKVNTVIQLALVAAALLQPVIGAEEARTCVTCLSWTAASTTLVSTVAYATGHVMKA